MPRRGSHEEIHPDTLFDLDRCNRRISSISMVTPPDPGLVKPRTDSGASDVKDIATFKITE